MPKFHWVLYIFGIFLIITALKMLFLNTESDDPDKNIVVRFVRRFFPVTKRFHGEHFMVRAGSPDSLKGELPGEESLPDPVVESARPGAILLTPLALALILIETTDLIFAVDSIPAIFAITADPFIIFTSNIFAILWLRSLYFALAGMLDKFRYLKISLAVVLMLVGVKMLASKWLKAVLGEYFNFYLLGGILFILIAGVLASVIKYRKNDVNTNIRHTRMRTC